MNFVDDIVNEPQKPGLIALFNLSMWWRIFYGFLRLVLGMTLLQNIGQPLTDFIYSLMEHEFSGRTGDAVLEHVYTLFSTHDFTVTYFIAIYFIFWGLVDIILSLCLLRHVRTAFPVAMGLIVLFICYSIFRFTITHSLTLLLVIIIDFGILFLIHREYRRLKPRT